MKSTEFKTNVMRTLDAHHIQYRHYSYADTPALSGVDVATTLGQNPHQVFKTLVTIARSNKYYVFMIPVCNELDLKKAALAVGEKSVSMLPQRELLALTGYVHGGMQSDWYEKTISNSCRFFGPEFPDNHFQRRQNRIPG